MEAPFTINQRVVCVKSSKNRSMTAVIKKGETYTVEIMVECARCGQWMAGLKELIAPIPGVCACALCDNIVQAVATHCLVPVELLAPIVTQYSDITAELAGQVVIGDQAD